MYAVVVTVHVRPECSAAFAEATTANARASRHEPGNLRFDVLRGEDDPNRFLLYELYRAKDDFARHQQTAHYLTWKAAVAEMLAQPRVGLRYVSVFTGDEV